MPVIKIINKKYNSLNAMRNLIYYVMAAAKTPNRIMGAIAVYPIEEEKIMQQFKQTQVLHRNQKKNRVLHILLSFSAKESQWLNYKDYTKIGYSVANYYGRANHQVVFALHEDTDNPHIHFVVNRVNYITGKKYHQQHKDYIKIRTIAEVKTAKLVRRRSGNV